MTDDVWRRDEIESPCQKICILHHETKLCVGCSRTGDEIARWSRMTPDERRRIMAELSGRDVGSSTRRGGRAARIKRRPGATGS